MKFPISRAWMKLSATLRNVRWRDPLVQTWGLISGLLIVGIVAHYVPGGARGEKKNLSPAAELFSPGNQAAADTWRPGVPFSPDAGAARSSVAAVAGPDLRACAEKAAATSGWQYLAAPLRNQLAAVSGSGARISVTWSGTRGGDAKALNLYYTGTHNQSGGLTDDFIIGNGCRGKDGRIESTGHFAKTLAAAAAAPEGAEISICLVGDSHKLTAAQEAALGELINCIESRTGTATLAMRQPQSSGLLAGSPPSP
jgi:hypothetical protein